MRWERVRLGEVVDLNPALPSDVRNSNLAREVPFLSMAAVSESGFATCVERRPMSEVLKGYTYFGRGDVLLAKITPCFENGKAAHLQQLPDDLGFGSTEFHVLRPGPDVDGRFLFHFVRSHPFRSGAVSRMTGSAGQRRVPAFVVAQWPLPLPPLPEQRRIAAILDKADAIRRKRQESLGLLDELLRSTFLEVFGDPVRNERGWKVVRLGEVADIVSGLTKGRKPRSTVRPVPYLRVANVQDGFLDLAEVKEIDATEDEIARYRLLPGDLVVTEGGDPDKLGRGSVWGETRQTWIHQNHVFRIRLQERGVLTPAYLSALLGAPYGKRYFLGAAKQTTGIASINKTQLGEFPVLVPPFSIQRRYAEVVGSLAHIRSEWRMALQETTTLFNALSQRAFQGRL